MPKSRVRKNRGKGKGAKAKRKARRELNKGIQAGLEFVRDFQPLSSLR